ncbi:hypothetical protein [Noviherbaspirillum humi]|uniref:hypothetical protein n=1 Tax=Noviherbaspirillum humi TaxID=1688639 RepID=UPI001595CF56|nr:hypothetical protein [Noviherbaspirillum humi]
MDNKVQPAGQKMLYLRIAEALIKDEKINARPESMPCLAPVMAKFVGTMAG